MRFWLYHAIYPLFLFLVLIIVFKQWNLDLKVARIFFNYELNQWSFGDSWWASTLIHRWGRTFVALIFLVASSGFLISFLVKRLQSSRYILGYIVLTMLLATGAVALLQQLSNVDCPWDLWFFNGTHPYYHLFDDKAGKTLKGVCFPGGHSSGGFSLLVFYFVYRDYNKYYAYIILGIASIIGCSFAFAQWGRGAHFVSHDLWSAMICWCVALLLYKLILQPIRVVRQTRGLK